MSRVDPVAQNVLAPSLKIAFERHVQKYNTPITNMKGTLGHSLLSFSVYMEWYPLYERVGQITDYEGKLLSAFAGQMMAANIFNNVIETDTDNYLKPYVPVKYSSV